MSVRFVCTSWSSDVPDGWVIDWDEGIASLYDPDTEGVLTISTYRKEGDVSQEDLDGLVAEIEGRHGAPAKQPGVAFPLGLFVQAVEEGETVHHWMKASEDLLVYASYHGDAASLPVVEEVVQSLVGYAERARLADLDAADS